MDDSGREVGKGVSLGLYVCCSEKRKRERESITMEAHEAMQATNAGDDDGMAKYGGDERFM